MSLLMVLRSLRWKGRRWCCENSSDYPPLHHPTHPQPLLQLPPPQVFFSTQKKTEKEKDLPQLQPPHPTNPLFLFELPPSSPPLFISPPHQTSVHHPPPFTSLPPLSPSTPSHLSSLPTPEPKLPPPCKAPLIL